MPGRLVQSFIDDLRNFAWFIWESPWRQLLWHLWLYPPMLWLIIVGGLPNIQLMFDTRIMPKAMTHIRKDYTNFEPYSVQSRLLLASSTIGAILGALYGTWSSDEHGRRESILKANRFLFVGSLVTVLSNQNVNVVLIMARMLFGIGIGCQSTSMALFISEHCPPLYRSTLNTCVFTVGNIIGTYLSDWVNGWFAEFAGAWRWMLGIVPLFLTVIQYSLMKSFMRDTPIWWLRQLERTNPHNIDETRLRAYGKAEEAMILTYPPKSRRIAFGILYESRADWVNEGYLDKWRNAFTNVRVLKVIIAGISLQVATQISGLGLKAVIKYSSNLLQYAGYPSGTFHTVLSSLKTWVTCIKIGINLILVDRLGKKRTIIYCLGAIVVVQVYFSLVFYVSEIKGQKIGMFEMNDTCVAVDCLTCIKKCKYGFCTIKGKAFDSWACLREEGHCQDLNGHWFDLECPSYIKYYATIPLFVVLLAFDLGLGTIPDGLTAEIYTYNYRGLGAGIATSTRWMLHLYFTLTSFHVQATWSPSTKFLVNGFLSTMCWIPFAYWLPETTGTRVLPL